MDFRLMRRIYRLRARILRNMLAMISFSAILASCGSGNTQKQSNTDDSLKKVNEAHRLDSIAKTDSIAKAKADSIALKAKEDSLAKVQTSIPVYVPPVIYNDPGPICEYGVVPVYDDIDIPVEETPTLTKYGVPQNF
ncbi:MAG: hypothetical protein CVU11_08185 [Bacteroidetes bacterium HGW-Bacteroidetes-6]|jgi:hypothetical protein|nr:MAG: hypothetical protein CVU11_08185 [Bacteroidetes bacterium HGW-Bacteroidetes-6]